MRAEVAAAPVAVDMADNPTDGIRDLAKLSHAVESEDTAVVLTAVAEMAAALDKSAQKFNIITVSQIRVQTPAGGLLAPSPCLTEALALAQPTLQ